MVRLRHFLRYLFRNFGPLIAFWALYLALGIRAAVGATVAYVVADVILHLRRGERFTRIYVLSSTLAVVFGTIDLIAVTPFMLKYEAVITNVATGCFFIASAHGKKPLIQEFAEQRHGSLPDRADVRCYFQLFTYAWAAYFFLKAAGYVAIGQAFPLATAMVLRSIIGGISFAVMIGASILIGRRGFFLLQRLRWLPHVAPEPGATAPDAISDPG